MSPLLRAATFHVVFDGQSLNQFPASPNTYPEQLMASYPTVPYENVAVDGLSWTTLATTVTTRLNLHAKAGLTSILIMCGGTTDIATEGDTAQATYDQMVTYANNARTAGFDKVIATTITDGFVFDAGEQTIRAAFNVLLLADASDAFDGVADLDAAMPSRLDTTYYADGLHWTTAGAALAASTVATVLLAAVPGFP